jgi:TonB family protein
VQRHRSIFGRALGASLLLHLLLLFVIVPGAQKVWPVSLSAASIFEPTPPSEQAERPLEFEFVDLADDREEPPVSDRVPLSDLDRRAHGGEGEAGADSPGSAGTTEQLVQAAGAEVFGRGAVPQQAAPPNRQVPPPEREPRRPVEEAPAREPEARPDTTAEGAGEREQLKPPAEEPRIALPPSGSWALPPGVGGLPENPDRDGGTVDEGGLSFDTQWYDWGPYAAKMLRKIRRNWQIPEIARLGVSGVVRIRFFIERNGEVTGLTITDESGRPPMDFAARDAIADSSAFDPLPSDLTGVAREGVTITFYYNTSPPRR